MTRAEIETALDQGRLEILVGPDRWWRVRRNGRTQTWKTRPGEFRIPIKAGLRVYAAITDLNMDSGTFRVRTGGAQ
jgi:hypothetical protein